MRDHCVCGHIQEHHNSDGCFADPEWCECFDYEFCEGPIPALQADSSIWCPECLRWVIGLVHDALGS